MKPKIQCPRCGCGNFTISIEYSHRDVYSVYNNKLTLDTRNQWIGATGKIFLSCCDCIQENPNGDPNWIPSEEEKKLVNKMLIKRQIVDVSHILE